MANTSVDSFIRIFKFYQANPLVRKERDSTGKIQTITLNDIFKSNSLIYQDTIDVYLHSLTLDSVTQLSYDEDSDTIQHALNAREKLGKYFSKVLYPGSYAYSTLDNAAIRRMMLDWSSTIKTIQDANRKVTNAYSLSDTDVDKAIRGFGIDFINNSTIKSADRRKNFLLKICDLYSIKGSPDSIIQALNVIGLEDIFIREAWICKDVEKYNGDYDLRIKWQAQKVAQEFDDVQNTYVELNTHDDIYTSWEWFQEKIHDNASTFDPHWFYTDSEIKLINNKADTFIKLPSITPYFGIEFVSDLDRNIDSLDTLFAEINREFQTFFTTSDQKGKTIWVDTFPNRLNALECCTGLIYTLIRVDEHIQYENFKSFLELNKFSPPDFEKPYEYFKLIYWMYQHKDDTFEISYKKLLNDYIPIKSNTYTSYENVLRWWLEEEVSDFERKGTYDDVEEKWDNDPFIKDPLYIQPIRTPGSETYSNFISLQWDNPYPIGRYCVESYNSEEGWVELVSNAYVYESTMHCAVMTDYAEHGSEDVSDFRIVLYHHPQNIPDIFFHQPFNFNGKSINTMMDRVLRYNGPITSLSFYDTDDPIRQMFSNHQIEDSVVTYDTISGYHEQQASGNIRTTQIHDDIKAYYASVYNYPAKTKLFEDKWMNINSTFYDYVDWCATSYYDTITHNGLLESNIVRDRKWPINKNWNWAIDSKYYYLNYESNKWMRYPVSDFETSNDATLRNYGDRVIMNGKLKVYVSNNYWAVIDGVDFTWDNRDSDLLTTGKIKVGSKLSRTLAVGQIKNETILNLLYLQTTADKQSETYKESLKQLNQSTIEIYIEPYGNDLVTTNCYTFENFLIYLYNSRLTLDFTSGYIYPVIEGCFDDHCRVYVKCTKESGGTQWIRFNNIRDNIEWSDCEGCESIYNDNLNLGALLPPYTLPNRYDSTRMLDGRTFNYRKELLAAFESGTIPDDVNLVVVRPYVETDGDYKETESKYKNTIPVIYKKLQVVTSSGSLKITYDWVPLEENRFQDCKLGLNPELLDWIEEMFESNSQNFVDLPYTFAEALNNYLINDMGITGSIIDLIIASWSNSSIVKKIVNYYKPKRARLLFISDALDSDYALSNGLDSLGLTDCNYNYYDLVTYRWGNPNFDSKNLSRMNRQRITHVINEYMPVEDTIYKDSDDSNKLFNHREIHSPDSKIPEIEVYDELVDINRQKIATRNGTAIAAFYLQNLKLEDSMAGFYYEISLDGGEKIYSNNSWYFQKADFVYKYATGRIKITSRWALFKSDNNDNDKDNAYYVADHETGTISSDHDYPWICDDDETAMKYGNCTAHSRFINDYDYSEGEFLTQRFVKVGLRTISPVIYFRCFDNEACNGFYYHDESIHPDMNDLPVYYNLKGKMISLVDTSNYYTRTDPVTGNSVSKFWCISDYRQIVDFGQCDYFAYATSYTTANDLSIFDSSNSDFTKEFFKLNGSNDYSPSNPSALVGCRVSWLYDHEDVIRDTEGIYTAEYDKYTSFRRNHINTVQLKNEPIACLVSDGVTVCNYFNHTDNTKKIHYGNETSVDSNPTINLVLDDIGNAKGAFAIRENTILRSQMNSSQNWTVSMRIKFNTDDTISQLFDDADDLVTNKWYMITYTSEGNLFVDGELRSDISQKFIEYGKFSFNNVNCDISEFGIWDYVLTEWYINVISNFRILRNRPETNKSKTSKSASTFRPLFAQEQPRIVFNRWSTGLPENIVGGRLEEYFADEYKISREENPLWVNRIDHKLEEDLIVKGTAFNEPARDTITCGTELESSGDYITPDNTIQWWWMRYNSDFRTGPIHHRPVYVSSKELINDPYPTIKNGQQKSGDYCDIGLCFDGVDNGNDNVFDDETYDENTGFGFQRDTKVKLENCGDTFKNKETLNNIVIPDLAQLTLTPDSLRNFIFHDTIYLYNTDDLYTEFNGVWTHKYTVDSWKEGDFKECYSKGDGYEAVFTYHKDVGYFWWEIRKYSDDNVWETYFRTYVNARHNQSRLMYVYDLLNYHQIDICNQKLCKFKENEFLDKCWAQVDQEFVSGSFGCNTWIRFNTTKSSENTHPGIDRYFDGKLYHMVFNDEWYVVKAEKDFVGFDKLPEEKTPSGYLYANNYLYIWYEDKNPKIEITYTDDKTKIAHKTQVENPGYWIRIACDLVTISSEKIPYEQWKFRKTLSNAVIVNVIDSANAEYEEETYVSPDIIDIRETMWKLIKFNGINDWKWENHMNEEFPYLKSVNNDVACTYTSLQDTLWYITYEVNAVGDYIKVRHSNGVIDFVTSLGTDDVRIGTLKYKKVKNLSNV